jgi:hypothetical protein
LFDGLARLPSVTLTSAAQLIRAAHSETRMKTKEEIMAQLLHYGLATPHDGVKRGANSAKHLRLCLEAGVLGGKTRVRPAAAVALEAAMQAEEAEREARAQQEAADKWAVDFSRLCVFPAGQGGAEAGALMWRDGQRFLNEWAVCARRDEIFDIPHSHNARLTVPEGLLYFEMAWGRHAGMPDSGQQGPNCLVAPVAKKVHIPRTA